MTDSSDLLNGLLPFPVSFTTLALILFIIIAAIGFVRGVLRMIFGAIALAIGSIAAYFTYQNAPLFFERPRVILIVSIVAGLVVYLLARKLILGILLRPLLGKHRGVMGGKGALVSIIPAAFLIWTLANGFRLSGTMMEMEQTEKNVTAAEGEKIEDGWIAHLRGAMDNDWLASFLAKIDPFVERGKAALVQILISSKDEGAPDAIASYDKDAAEVIRHPAIQKLKSDPEIRQLIDNGEYVQLLQHPKVREAAKNNRITDKLKSIDIGATLEKALYSSQGKDQPKVRTRIPKRLWRNQ
ncbi:MAG: hypothetical protein ACI9UA_001020 [Pseudoalteromonas tetraodonis]